MRITPSIDEYLTAFDEMVDVIVKSTDSLPRLDSLLFEGENSSQVIRTVQLISVVQSSYEFL